MLLLLGNVLFRGKSAYGSTISTNSAPDSKSRNMGATDKAPSVSEVKKFLTDAGGKYVDHKNGIVYEVGSDGKLAVRDIVLKDRMVFVKDGDDLVEVAKEFHRTKLFQEAIGTFKGRVGDAEALALMFDNDLAFYGNDDLSKRLGGIFSATELRSKDLGFGAKIEGIVPGLHTGLHWGDSGYDPRFQDGSPTQTGHFLTGLRFALEPGVLNQEIFVEGTSYGSTRKILEGAFPNVANISDKDLALRLAIGHEKATDPPGAHHVLQGNLDPRTVIIEQYRKVTDSDVSNFKTALQVLASTDVPNFNNAEPYLKRIMIQPESKRYGIRFNMGNSYEDLRLTLGAYDAAARMRNGDIRTRQDFARYIRTNLK